MITCKLNGGLGNQLFIISHIFSFAKRYGLEYAIPLQVENPHIAGKGTYIFPGINYSGNIPELTLYKEQTFHYTPLPKIDNVCFYGYFQAWRYFDEYKTDLLKAFGFNDLPTNKGFVSIHVRMGDYVRFPDHHPVVSLEYIEKAVAVFKKEDVSFQIFSDDIEAAKNYIPREIFNDHNYEFEETGDELADLKYMAMAEHNITANSSFSAWAAYINPNPNKKIIQPAIWFGKLIPNNTADLYLPNATII